MVTISNSQIDLIAPNNIEAERAVLGSMLIEKEAIEIAMDTLSENDFYLTAHKIIFREIIDTYDRNKGDVDIILINDHLKSNAEITRLGGSVYLTSLVDTVITASNVEYYAKIVKDKAVLRELEHAGRKIIGDATTIGISDVSEVVDKVAQMIFNISEKRVLKGPVSISDMINPALDNIEAIYQNKEQVPGIPSGFADLDKITGGFKKSNFIIIAGRPGTGKTSLAKIIIKTLGCDYLILNASDERGIDTIREKIKRFVKKNYPKLKVIYVKNEKYGKIIQYFPAVQFFGEIFEEYVSHND